MATKTPLVIPDNTSFSEIGDRNRAKLIPSGSDPSLFIVKENDNDRIRPLTDVKAAADIIEDIMDGKNLPNVDAAFQWVQDHSWEQIVKQWDQIIQQAAQAAEVTNSSPRPQFQLSRAQRRKMEREAKKKAK